MSYKVTIHEIVPDRRTPCRDDNPGLLTIEPTTARTFLAHS